jgi:hypothetical protein
VDHLRDYNDVRNVHSMTQRLEVDSDIAKLLKAVEESGAAIGAGLRQAKLRLKSDGPTQPPLDWTNIYFVLAPKDTLPSSLRVPKVFNFG